MYQFSVFDGINLILNEIMKDDLWLRYCIENLSYHSITRNVFYTLAIRIFLHRKCGKRDHLERGGKHKDGTK